MYVRRLALFIVASSIIGGLGLAGCSSADEGGGEDPAVVAKRDAAQQQFDDDVDWVVAKYEKCSLELAQTGTCVVDGDTKGTSFVVTVEPQGLGDALAAARRRIAQVRQIFSQLKSNICGVLGPFAGLNHPYFYYGAYAQAGIIGQAQGGVDVVFDMNNLQAAAFGYKGYGASSLIGGEAGGYVGYGFGNKSGVIDAWSGRFCTASGSVGLPAKLLSAGASVFASPDGTVYGGAVGASVGYDAIPTPVDGGVFSADWGAWDGATSALDQNTWFVSSTIKTDPATGKKYIQYASAKDMALALLYKAPQPMGIQAAAQVIALDIQKRTGLTIDKMCPREAAAAKNQSPLPNAVQKAVKACGNLPPLGGSGGSGGGGAVDGGASDSGLDPTDCGDKSDGWWCLASKGWMAYCKGKQIAGGCPCQACTQAGTQASCSNAPPPAACSL